MADHDTSQIVTEFKGHGFALIKHRSVTIAPEDGFALVTGDRGDTFCYLKFVANKTFTVVTLMEWVCQL